MSLVTEIHISQSLHLNTSEDRVLLARHVDRMQTESDSVSLWLIRVRWMGRKLGTGLWMRGVGAWVRVSRGLCV